MQGRMGRVLPMPAGRGGGRYPIGRAKSEGGPSLDARRRCRWGSPRSNGTGSMVEEACEGNNNQGCCWTRRRPDSPAISDGWEGCLSASVWVGKVGVGGRRATNDNSRGCCRGEVVSSCG